MYKEYVGLFCKKTVPGLYADCWELVQLYAFDGPKHRWVRDVSTNECIPVERLEFAEFDRAGSVRFRIIQSKDIKYNLGKFVYEVSDITELPEYNFGYTGDIHAATRKDLNSNDCTVFIRRKGLYNKLTVEDKAFIRASGYDIRTWRNADFFRKYRGEYFLLHERLKCSWTELHALCNAVMSEPCKEEKKGA